MPDLAPPLIAWYREHARDLPWRREGFGAWGTLVSEFMLQQTQVARVIPRLEEWLARWPTPADLAAAPPADAVRLWANLGYPRRALWLHRAATEIRDRHDGAVPRDVDALLALTGIGDYTARAVAVFAFGDRHPVVDTNTRRVLARAVDGRSQPGAPGKRDLAAMTAVLPEDDGDAAVINAAAMELGAVVCTARSPRCDACPIAQACAWRAAGYPDTGDERRKQARFEGSDRQARGAVMKVLRDAVGHVAVADDVLADWPDPGQRDRAIDSLIADGLVEAADGALHLPR
ncbi:A/G-specific adenine glycosylase [Microbacterium sp. EYE_5]|uniref:A/G-specific adenine glycosylase n=1 Tax=unclassified Microbacterium TaxID=2609290 RepID=UPI002005CA89|nr:MULTISPECIES: A/G-specific adenine glycosylase [unclassified Microbacterium]MCK6081365.1 A/G-specific adenine glycosylase [Microbacterium sp. EYE_382]MCK6086635.1 A/G-specific adenine glycosylase [Microbacterium sp. EYE_384]MCK6123867.1 A/G-specific adenine glycosylase [Microbacterium sp. EYE_80]MCK6126776.1 A/G-specific adenine glycosylase [Microbacterium sp. EYE_79]MCK6142320.1 A/G-specific adenine glycosylase [Microbacterium sp. EYE_39]